jgi:ribosomal protein S18 acetylase RimI-like enzyme
MTYDPVGDQGLNGFSCGTRRNDREVNELVEHIWLGECPYKTSVLIMEDVQSDNTQTVGVCAWRPRHPDGDDREEFRPGMPQYVHAIGVSERYRGCITTGGVGVGHLLLEQAMKQISHDHPDAPFVWAYVAKSNRRSHDLFDQHNFKAQAPKWEKRFTSVPRWVFPKRPEADVVRLRESYALTTAS